MKRFFKFVFYAIIALIVFGFVMAMLGDDKPKTDTAKSEPVAEAKAGDAQAEEPKEEVLVVSSTELAKAYESNEVAADKQYKGKMLEVTGTVKNIGSSFGDKAQVSLSGTNDFNHVFASGDSAFDEYAATLSKGQKVTLICESGGESLGSASLKDCKPKQ